MPKRKPTTTGGATRPRQFRLKDETLDLLDRIAAHHGLTSRADAIRIAAKAAADAIPDRTRYDRLPR